MYIKDIHFENVVRDGIKKTPLATNVYLKHTQSKQVCTQEINKKNVTNRIKKSAGAISEHVALEHETTSEQKRFLLKYNPALARRSCAISRDGQVE